MVRIFKYLIITFALAVFGVTYAYANVVRLALIDYSDFREVGDDIYLSDELPEDAEQKVVALLTDARKNLAAHYGEPKAEPVVVVLGNKEEINNYGLKHFPGMFLVIPWNSYLLLNYRTATLDVVAHELVHAEIAYRVRYLKRKFDFQTWF